MKEIFPTLYAVSKTGKTKEWIIEAVQNLDGTASIVVSAGYIDGKKQISKDVIVSGKNIGRSNETSPFQQAKNEAKSRWLRQKDKAYRESMPLASDNSLELDAVNGLPLPMLAEEYLECINYVYYPIFAQPKYNGVRALSGIVNNSGKDELFIWSRKAKRYSVIEQSLGAHITPFLNALHKDFPGAYLDGELYVHGLSLQSIISAVKKDGENTGKVHYRLYDIAGTDMSQEDRFKYLDSLFQKVPTTSSVILSETASLTDEDAVKKYHAACRQRKFEGIILRNKNAKYVYRHRSENLLKYKEFHEREYKIIGGAEGRGKDSGTIIFKCITDDGKPFDCRPRGTVAQRKEWFRDLSNLIGKMLTIRYQDLSEDGIPTILTGIAIRDYE